MDFISIKDTITDLELKIVLPTEGGCFVIDETACSPVKIQKRSIGKFIRAWMKEREKDIG